MSLKTCEVCSRKIELSEHPFGLVFDDRIFICEDCRKERTDKDIKELVKTTMQNPVNGMPIALWLIHEENKDKTMMTIKK